MSNKTEIKQYQKLINSGQAWTLEGSVGRYAMDLINNGYCYLGLKGHKDYWGNYVPGRYEVKPGTKGSILFVKNCNMNRGEN